MRVTFPIKTFLGWERSLAFSTTGSWRKNWSNSMRENTLDVSTKTLGQRMASVSK